MEVSNPISSLTRSTSIVVVQPVPSDLQVILRPTQGNTPSCVPVSDTTSLPTVSVFVDEEVEFQASVAMGINLTFVWMFDEDSNRMNVTEVLAEVPGCEGIACMQDTQVCFDKGWRHFCTTRTEVILFKFQAAMLFLVIEWEFTFEPTKCMKLN